LGQASEKPFSQIWHDPDNAFLMALKERKKHLTGRCRLCRFLDYCGGGLRARAYYLGGQAWASDPACYLTDDEIGLSEGYRPEADPESLSAPSPPPDPMTSYNLP
jgi:radical SAM protein with 4Fe4S-binding SPASM domain